MKILAGVLVSLVAFVVLFMVYYLLGLWLATAVEDAGRWWWQVLIWTVLGGMTLLDAYLGIWTYRCLDRRCPH